MIQLAAESVYKDDSMFPTSKSDQLIQSGTIIIDQHTGEIRGVVGHRGVDVLHGFNYATMLKRQPGSSFKPLAVYGPALEKGYTPDSMLFDGDLNINGYQPKDYDHQTRGQVTLTEAVAQSWNIPAVWLLNQIGIDVGMNYATRAGIALTQDDRKLGIALGGLSVGTSPLQMAQAFTAFANAGNMIPAHTITKMLSRSGKVLATAKAVQVKVTTPEAAATMTMLLANAVKNGSGNAAASDRPTAGKTGTTELPDTPEFNGISGAVAKDAWFVGYTPELTAAVWMGYVKTDKDHYLTTGSAASAAIFKEIMARALKDQPIVPFVAPDKPAAAKDNAKQNGKKDDQQPRNKQDQGKNNGKKNK